MSAADSNRRTLAGALYLVAAILIVIPLTDALPMLWPLRVGQTEWRFGVVGILSGALTLPLLGAFLAVAAAGVLAHRRVLMVGAWLLLAVTVVLVLATGLFTLDLLELLSRVQERARPLMQGAAEKAALKLALGTAVTLVLGISAWRISRRLREEHVATAKHAPAVLVRAERDGAEKSGE